MAPFGVASGYVTVTLAWQLQASGMATGATAALVALSVWPQTWKVLWAPLVDTTLGLKRWHAIGTVLTAVSLVAFGLVPPVAGNYAWLAVLVVASSVASTLLAMAGEAMMAEAFEDERRGIVSGWAQAANLGGMGLGGGLALWISQHSSGAWLPGLGAGLLCLGAVAALPLVHLDPRVEPRLHLGANLAAVLRRAVGAAAVAGGGAGESC